VLGQPPFQTTSLSTSGDLAYVGGNWTRDIAFAGNSIPLTVRGGVGGDDWLCCVAVGSLLCACVCVWGGASSGTAVSF
jgi:hypothetical protein